MLRASSSRGVESRARGTLVIRPYGRLFVAWELFSVLLLFLYAASAALWFGEDNAVKTNHRACMDRSPAFASAGRIHDAVEPPILYSSAPPPPPRASCARRWWVSTNGAPCLDAPLAVVPAIAIYDAAGVLDAPRRYRSALLSELAILWRKFWTRARRRKCGPLDPRPTRDRPAPCARMCRLADAIKACAFQPPHKAPHHRSSLQAARSHRPPTRSPRGRCRSTWPSCCAARRPPPTISRTREARARPRIACSSRRSLRSRQSAQRVIASSTCDC